MVISVANATTALAACCLELGACGLDYIGEWPSARAVGYSMNSLAISNATITKQPNDISG